MEGSTVEAGRTEPDAGLQTEPAAGRRRPSVGRTVAALAVRTAAARRPSVAAAAAAEALPRPEAKAIDEQWFVINFYLKALAQMIPISHHNKRAFRVNDRNCFVKFICWTFSDKVFSINSESIVFFSFL